MWFQLEMRVDVSNQLQRAIPFNHQTMMIFASSYISFISSALSWQIRELVYYSNSPETDSLQLVYLSQIEIYAVVDVSIQF